MLQVIATRASLQRMDRRSVAGHHRPIRCHLPQPAQRRRFDLAEAVRGDACTLLTTAIADGCWDAWLTTHAIAALEALTPLELEHDYEYKGNEIIAACLDRAAGTGSRV